MTQQQYLSLTADEVMVLTDRVLNHDRGTDDMACSAYALLLRLGSAYVEMLADGKRTGEVTVAVSEAEGWLLRSKITSGDKTASDSLFGVKLLAKLYRLLLAYNVNIELQSAGPEGQELTEEDKRALQQWGEPYRKGA